MVGYLREAWGKTGEELPDSWKVGRGNIYESMEEYLPLVDIRNVLEPYLMCGNFMSSGKKLN